MGDLLDDVTSRDLWRHVGNAVPLEANGGAVWRVSVRPSRGPGVLAALEAAFGARCFLDWGGGLVWIAGPATEEAHAAVEAAAGAAGGNWMLVRAPDALRVAVAVVPDEAEALARIGARVKVALDPRGILNPGRIRAG